MLNNVLIEMSDKRVNVFIRSARLKTKMEDLSSPREKLFIKIFTQLSNYTSSLMNLIIN
jgi:hypothetical protein